MKDHHTPQKEDLANRRFKESRLKKPQKIAKKSLNGVFTSVSEDVSSETIKDSRDFSPKSEISDANYSSEMTQSSVLSFSASSGRFPLSDLAPTSKIRTASDEPDDLSIERYRFHKPDGSVEVDIVEDFLKQARNLVLSSDSADQQSKKLLDALVNVVLDECYSLPEERDWYFEFVSAKGRIVFLCFLLWSFVVSVIFFFGFGLDNPYIGPSPT